MQKVRINKFLASCEVASRRKAEKLILEGKVEVNGKVIKDLSFKVDPKKDIVKVNGKIIKPKEEKVYYILYKPRGYLTQLGKDKFGRKTLTDLLEKLNIKERVFPVGRLDYDSEGLLLLTNDGEFAYKYSHPKFEIEKEYIVEVKGIVDKTTLEKMKKGRDLEDGFFKPDKLKLVRINKEKNTSTLKFCIHSGKKRILRRFCKAFGYDVIRLIRTKMGKYFLGSLRPGEIKKLGKR